MARTSTFDEVGSADSRGFIKEDSDGSLYINVYAHTDLTKGQPYSVAYDGDEGSNPKTAAPATSSVYQYIGIATEAASSGDDTWLQIKGDCSIAMVTGATDVAKDDFLEVINGETALQKDGTSRTTNSIGIAREAYADAADAAKKVYLFGDRAILAGS